MKNKPTTIWLSLTLVTALVLGNTLYAKKSNGGLLRLKVSEQKCKTIRKWETQGKFTEKAGAKYGYYVEYIGNCRLKFPELMGVYSDTEYKVEDKEEADYAAAAKKCLTYRIWDIKKKFPPRVTDAKQVLSQCKKKFSALFKKPKISVCKKYQKWFDNGVFTKNRGDLFVAELCRHY